MTKQSLSTIVFFFLLVSISSTQMEAEIDSKAFKEIMDDFVEVHEAAGAAVDLGLVIANVKISLAASEKAYKEFINSFNLSSQNARGKVDSYIKSLNTALNEANNAVKNTWANQRAKGQKTIKEAGEGIKRVEGQLAAIHKQLSQIVIDYHNGVAESDNKLHVVKQLRDIIEDELLNPGSFVQIKKFNEKLNTLQSLIQKSGDTMYTPIIQTLISLASQGNFSDQKILRAILDNLKQLETSLNNYKKERETDMNVNLKNLKAQEENLNGQLNDYHKLEQRGVSDVHEANQNTELLNTEITNLTSEIARKRDEFKAIEHLANTENAMFKSGIQRIELMRKDVSEASNHVISLAAK